MPRKTQPQGRPEKQDIQVDQKIKHEAFLYSNPPKGNLKLNILRIYGIYETALYELLKYLY